jgi:hypothetical protein
MTSQLPVEQFEPDVDVRTRRMNGWELALWIVGVVLFFGGLTMVVGIVKLLLASVSEPTTNGAPLTVALEAFSIAGPGILTGGIVCLALALFSRALDVNSRRRDESRATAASVASPSISSPAESTPATKTPPPSARSGQPEVPVDYSAYMRPSGDSPDSRR